jgi:heptosyltransferase III
MRRLLVRPGAIGDCLCSLPALWMLQSEYTEIWTNGAVMPLVGFGDRVRSLAGSGFSLLGLPADPPRELLDWLGSFDEILSWSGENQPKMQRHAKRFNLPLHLFPALPAPDAGIHVSDWMIRHSKRWHTQLGQQHVDEEPEAWRRPGGRRFLLSTPPRADHRSAKPLVVLHPYSGSPRKNWPLPGFERLASDLSTIAEIRWCASPEDPLPGHLRNQALLHADLLALAEALQGASLYIGNDSGISHLAAMLGVPTLVLFGPMDPAVWAPRGALVSVLRTPRVGHAASEIPFEAVCKAARKVLENVLVNP